MASALSLQPGKDSLPRPPPLDFSFPTMLFSLFPDNIEGAGNVSAKWVKILIVPCSCVWAVREMEEPLLNSPLWPGHKSEQLQRHHPGNTPSTLRFPDGHPLLSLPSSEISSRPPQLTPAHPCKLVPGAGREKKGRGIAFSHSVLPELSEDCAEWSPGENHAPIEQGLNVK